MADMELDIVAVKEVDKVADISDPKLTRLACLRSFANLLVIISIQPFPMLTLLNIFGPENPAVEK